MSKDPTLNDLLRVLGYDPRANLDLLLLRRG